MNKEDYYNNLVNNMFENLEKSIDCIETDSKMAIIYYFSALELLFKARLFKEHWAFILQNIDDRKATINNLKNGDFLTVSFDTAISRIQNLLQDLEPGYEKYFDDLRNIRNRLVHFDCIETHDPNLSIKNISKTWYYIYTLLNDKWKDMFSGTKSKIEEINIKMKQYSEHFWNSKKEALINKHKNKYENNPLYTPIIIHNKPLVCDYCMHSYDKDTKLNLMQFEFDNQTFTLTRKCDICEHGDNLFLFSLYLQKNNSIDIIKSKFIHLIDANLWKNNNSVNKSHYNLLLNTNAEDINIDFSDIIDFTYDNYNIDISKIDDNTTNIGLNCYIDFSIIGKNKITYYYVLYTTLQFKINKNENEIYTSRFNDLYDSIENLRVDFYVDSDGF